MLAVKHLQKTYLRPKQPGVEVLKDITFDVHRGEFLSLVGPSGCGKTTLLGCIAGLRDRSGGSVRVNNRDVTGPPEEMAVIFQEYGRTLLPWRSALGNVMFGMENRHNIRSRDRIDLARDALSNVGLSAFENSYPWQLSGGQQQRIAIARGIANGSDILLMDEPFASVDAQTRLELEDLLLQVWTRLARTILFVTHDIDEAIYLSDRIVVLSRPPCTVLKTITVEIDRPREKLSTRENPAFLEYRRDIHRLLAPAPKGAE